MVYYSSKYERFILASVEQEKELGGMIRLMIGFFVSSLARRWMDQFQVAASSITYSVVQGNISHAIKMKLGFSKMRTTLWQTVHPGAHSVKR